MIPALLRLGSLNGNLTGMAFSKEHWRRVGPFKEDWRHAADWQWMIRACETKPLLLNREPIASVRTHEQQLSVRNRKSGHECQEVAAVVRSLLLHPYLKDEPRRKEWAGHVMQFQLWNMIKATSQGDWSQFPDGLMAIHRSSGLRMLLGKELNAHSLDLINMPDGFKHQYIINIEKAKLVLNETAEKKGFKLTKEIARSLDAKTPINKILAEVIRRFTDKQVWSMGSILIYEKLDAYKH
jgi:hypothetical protein